MQTGGGGACEVLPLRKGEGAEKGFGHIEVGGGGAPKVSTP